MADKSTVEHALRARIQQATASPLREAERDGIVRYLKESEKKLEQLMEGNHPPESESGDVNFGLILYWLKHYAVLHLLWVLLGRPEPTITQSMLHAWDEKLRGAGVTEYDGSLIAYSKYAELDFGWLTDTHQSLFIGWGLAFIDYLCHLLSGDKHPFSPKGTTTTLAGEQLTIAILGDWGTGQWIDGNDEQGPAITLLDQALKPLPDLTIHLGDVYYSGTSGFFGSETPNFVDQWKPGSQGSFTLNSNHEMYAGAYGYFDDALPAAMFSHQHPASFFAIDFPGWMVIGLDSAYNATLENTGDVLYSKGCVVDAEQKSFLHNLPLTDKNVIVLTHHNPITTEGSKPVLNGLSTPASSGPTSSGLWYDVTEALAANKTFNRAAVKGAPHFWYWGHIHNGISYNESSWAGQRGTHGRCSGHSAIPFGRAYGLFDADGNLKSTVDYVAHTPYSEYAPPTREQEKRVLNGYTVLKLEKNELVEEWYELGNNVAVHTQTWRM